MRTRRRSEVSCALPFRRDRAIRAVIHPRTDIAEDELVTETIGPILERIALLRWRGHRQRGIGEIGRHQLREGVREGAVRLTIARQRFDDWCGTLIAAARFRSTPRRRPAAECTEKPEDAQHSSYSRHRGCDFMASGASYPCRGR